MSRTRPRCGSLDPGAALSDAARAGVAARYNNRDGSEVTVTGPRAAPATCASLPDYCP